MVRSASRERTPFSRVALASYAFWSASWSSAILDVRVEGWILGGFGLALGALVVALALVIADLTLALRALQVEVEHLVQEP